MGLDVYGVCFRGLLKVLARVWLGRVEGLDAKIQQRLV